MKTRKLLTLGLTLFGVSLGILGLNNITVNACGPSTTTDGYNSCGCNPYNSDTYYVPATYKTVTDYGWVDAGDGKGTQVYTATGSHQELDTPAYYDMACGSTRNCWIGGRKAGADVFTAYNRTFENAKGCDGHAWHDYGIVTPTCTTQGVLLRHCGICNAVLVNGYSPALGHYYSAWIDSDANGKKDGVHHYRYCIRQRTAYVTSQYNLGHTDTHYMHYDGVGIDYDWITDPHNDGPLSKGKYLVPDKYFDDVQVSTHQFSSWSDTYSATDNGGTTTGTRKCIAESPAPSMGGTCNHTENRTASLYIDPINTWVSDTLKVSWSYEWYADDGRRLCKSSAQPVSVRLDRTNLDTGEVKTVQTGGTSYIESEEGRYRYDLYIADSTGSTLNVHGEKALLDHSAPQIKGKVSIGGYDNVGNKFTDAITWIESTATQRTDTKIETAETKWTNAAPTITVSATDYLTDTTVNGVGLKSIVIYDDEGNIVSDGVNETSYTLNNLDEGTHTWTIVATDSLSRKDYVFGTPVYDATQIYTLGYVPVANLSAFTYDINHVTITKVITHYDITAPVLLGAEDSSNDVNVNTSNYYLDSRTVYLADNIISQTIHDYPSNSANSANDQADVARVTVWRYDKADNKTLVARVIRDGDEYNIIPINNFARDGSGISFESGKIRTSEEILKVFTDGVITVTRDRCNRMTIYLDTDPRKDNNEEIVPELTDEEYEELEETAPEYYEIYVTDEAGNTTHKKLVPKYSELRSFHTSIDRSSYD